MKSLCVDGFNLSLPKGTGIATYGRNLLTNARGIGFDTEVLYGPAAPHRDDDVLNEAALVEPAGSTASALGWRQRVGLKAAVLADRWGREAKPVPVTGEVIWPQAMGGMPDVRGFWAVQDLYSRARRAFRSHGGITSVRFHETAERGAPDVMHWTTVLPVHAPGRPNIYTIHDLIPLRLPHTTLHDRQSFLAAMKLAASKADHIAVVSESTRQDVIRLLGVDENRVTNTYQAVIRPRGLQERSESDLAQELAGLFGLEWKGYFLHFGAIEPKKNLGRIVEAYLGSGVASPLVIAGGAGWLDVDETALLNQARTLAGSRGDQVLILSYLTQSSLQSLVQGARAVLFPSLYEGFGLPVLEAMMLGTAVLTSTVGALPEVAGDAALMVDPYDVPAMTRSIRTLQADTDLRQDLERRGRLQAMRFSPEAYRARLQGLYAKVF